MSTDNGSEFACREFREVVENAGARQQRIKAGHPHLERLHGTVR